MSFSDQVEKAHHTIDLTEIHGQPITLADGVDFVRVHEGRVYMRVIAEERVVATFRVQSHLAIRAMAANMLDVADRMEILDRAQSKPKGRRRG